MALGVSVGNLESVARLAVGGIGGVAAVVLGVASIYGAWDIAGAALAVHLVLLLAVLLHLHRKVARGAGSASRSSQMRRPSAPVSAPWT
jgi:hypothetical protein